MFDRTIAARARVAVLPCCNVFKANDQSALSGWVDGALAIDVRRVVKLDSMAITSERKPFPPA